MPMMPIDPAKLTSAVLAFLVNRLRVDRERAVRKDMEAIFSFFFFPFFSDSSCCSAIGSGV